MNLKSLFPTFLDDIKNEVEIEPVVRETEEEPEENKAEIIQDVEEVEPPLIQKPKSNKKLVLVVSLGLVGLLRLLSYCFISYSLI